MTPGKGKAGLEGWVVGFEGQREGGQQTQPPLESWKDHSSDREGRGLALLFILYLYLPQSPWKGSKQCLLLCTAQGFCLASENSPGTANGEYDSLLPPFKLQYLVWETENRSIASRAWKKENVNP